MLLRSDEWDNEVDIAAHGLTWSGNGDTFHSFDGINLAEKWYQKRYLCRAIEVSYHLKNLNMIWIFVIGLFSQADLEYEKYQTSST